MNDYPVSNRHSERIKLAGVSVVPLHLGELSLWIVTREGIAERGYTIEDQRAEAVIIEQSNAIYTEPAQVPLFYDIPYICGSDSFTDYRDDEEAEFSDTVSRQHAVLCIRNGLLRIRDLHTFAGTWYEEPVRLHTTSETERQVPTTVYCIDMYRLPVKSENETAYVANVGNGFASGLVDGRGVDRRDDTAAVHAARIAKKYLSEVEPAEALLPEEALMMMANCLAAINKSVAVGNEYATSSAAIDAAVMTVQRHARMGYQFAAFAWSGNIKQYLLRSGRLIPIAPDDESPSQPANQSSDHQFYRDKQRIEAEQKPSAYINGSANFVAHTSWQTVIPGDQLISLSADVAALVSEQEIIELCENDLSQDALTGLIRHAGIVQSQQRKDSRRTGLLAMRTII